MNTASSGARNAHHPIERGATIVLVILLLYAFGSGVYRASQLPFWFDEIATVAVAEQGTLDGVWNALAAAADSNPPTFYLLEAGAARVVSPPEVAYRLPSLAGFIGLCVALFVFVRHRRGAVAGLAAATMPFITPIVALYAVEARPYSLVTCCVAWAMVMWQRADDRWRAPVMGALLMGATALHYYAVVAIAPFAAAEAFRTFRTGQVRWRIWLAAAAGVVPLVVFWPLLAAFKQEYNATFWTQPKLLGAFGELSGISERWALPMVILVLAALLAVARKPSPAVEESTAPAIPLEERLLLAVFVVLPVLLYVPAALLKAPMAPRYVLSALLGLCAATAFVVSGVSRRATVWLALAVLFIIGVQQADYWRFERHVSSNSRQHFDLPVLHGLAVRHHVTGLPVVSSNALKYMSMAYYAGDAGNAPIFLIDQQGARRFFGSDAAERALSKLAPFVRMRLEPREAFIAAQRSFLIYSENQTWDWLPELLVEEGHSVRLLGMDKSAGTIHHLYRVDTRDASKAEER